MRSVQFRIIITSAMCTLLLVLCSTPLPAQKKILFTAKDLPAAVTAAFEKSYPNGMIIGAGKEYEKGKTTYEVESMDGTIRRDLIYNPDGTVVEIEETIDAKALPEAVTASLAKQFKKFEVKEAERMTRGETMGYELIVKVGKKLYEVSTDVQGKVLSKKPTTEKKDKNED